MTETELRRRIVALELAVDRLTVELSELKARPQPAAPIGGAGNTVFGPAGTQMLVDWRYNYGQTKAVGSNVSRETPKGPNGAGGPTTQNLPDGVTYSPQYIGTLSSKNRGPK